MDPVLTSLFIFCCVIAGTALGWLLGRVLPERHLSADSKDGIKVSIAMIATLSALVLGLLTASSKSALDGKQAEVRSMAADIVELDRTLALYGPAADASRALLKMSVRKRIDAIWPDESGNVDIGAVAAGTGIEDVTRAVLALAPSNDSERWLQSQALSLTMSIAAQRWTIVSQTSSAIQWPFVGVVTFWLAIVFASFTMFAPKNASVAMAMVISGLSVAGAFYLIIEMDQPYSGLIRISSEPVREVYATLGAP